MTPVPFLERDLQLSPGEVGAEAAVRAAGEAEVVAARAVDDELVRPIEDPRVAVGGGDQPVDHVALLERAAVELGVGRDLAPVAERDRVHPQRLLDRERRELGLGHEPPTVSVSLVAKCRNR